MADLLFIGSPRPSDWNDLSVPGARAYFYEAGTTNPTTVWQNEAGTIPHASPVEADGYGVFPAIFVTDDVDVDAQAPDGESLPGYPRRAVRASAPASAAVGVSFAPTEAIPAVNVQEAIETAQANMEAATAPLESIGVTGQALINAATQDAGRTALGLGTASTLAATLEATGIAAEDDDAHVPTNAAVKDYVDARALGAGQVWDEVTRTHSTAYQNTTGRTIVVQAVNWQNDPPRDFQVSPNGSGWMAIGQTGNPAGWATHVTMIIPPGWRWRCNGSATVGSTLQLS